MMPNMMQPSPLKPGATNPTEGGPDKDTIKMQLVSLLKQAQKMAQQNGLDWNEIMTEVSSNESLSGLTVPRPPRPDMMGGGMMPGGMGPG